MTRVTTGGLTGASAIKVAWMEIASGLSEVVLVVGVEKASDLWDPRTNKGTPEFLKAVSTGVTGITASVSRTMGNAFAMASMAAFSGWSYPSFGSR